MRSYRTWMLSRNRFGIPTSSLPGITSNTSAEVALVLVWARLILTRAHARLRVWVRAYFYYQSWRAGDRRDGGPRAYIILIASYYGGVFAICLDTDSQGYHITLWAATSAWLSSLIGLPRLVQSITTRTLSMLRGNLSLCFHR